VLVVVVCGTEMLSAQAASHQDHSTGVLAAPEQRSNYTEAVAALKSRFKPVDIEELRGLEFHQLMQTEESVEKLGLQLRSLAGKAFPSLGTRELDC